MKTLELMTRTSKASILGIGIASMLFFTACEQDDAPSIPADEIDAATVEAEAVAQSDFEEIDDMTSNIMSLADASSGGRVEAVDDDRCHCAEITHDKENKTITIDFGDGCKGPNGVVRSGIIYITYNGRRFIPGSTWTVTFRDFYVNRRHIEGLRTVTNISESLEDHPKFHITLEGGKVTWPDGTIATRAVDKVRVWVRAANPLFDEYHILTGSTTSGTNRREVAYKTEVLTDLVYKRSCRNDRKVRIPVQGTKLVLKREKTCVIDYGDGSCDGDVELRCDTDEVSDMSIVQE